jgi:hypothetical protein
LVSIRNHIASINVKKYPLVSWGRLSIFSWKGTLSLFFMAEFSKHEKSFTSIEQKG